MTTSNADSVVERIQHNPKYHKLKSKHNHYN